MNSITKEEFKTLSLMLKSSNDFDLAVSNIENLNLKPIYHVLFLKHLTLGERINFYEHFKETINKTAGFQFRTYNYIVQFHLSNQELIEKIIKKYYNEKDIKDCFKMVFDKSQYKIKLISL